MPTLTGELPTHPPLRGLLGNASFALVGDVALKGALFLVVLVSARTLEVGEFARLGVAIACATVLTAAFDLGAATIITRDGALSATRRGGIFAATLKPRALIVAVAVAVVVGLAAALGQLPIGIEILGLSATQALTLSVIALHRSAQRMGSEAAYRITAAGLTLLVGPLVAYQTGNAADVCAALAAAQLVPLWPLFSRARRIARFDGELPRGALRSALPFAAMAIATLVYYRSGVIITSHTSGDRQTALFTAASTIAFGLLAVPNAITTSLLPRLAAAGAGQKHHEVRRAIRVTLACCAALVIVVATCAWWALPIAFGQTYRAATTPLLILAVSSVLIGLSGVLGTLLIAQGRARTLGLQVAASLLVNLAATWLLASRMGATGAALGTLATEMGAVCMLLVSVERVSPGLIISRGRTRQGLRVGVREVAVLSVASTLALELWAMATGYGMRVTSDTPTFIALVRDMAARPFHAQSPFIAIGHVQTAHATPYMQLLAGIWRLSGASGDPTSIYRLLAVVGLAVTVMFFHAVFVWVRSISDTRTAWIAIPVVLALFGPACVIWATDVSFHGFMYSSYFPQNVATATMLYTFVLWHRPAGRRRALTGTALAATTMIVHPFTGVVLIGLVGAEATRRALVNADGWETPVWGLPAAFLAASAWPAYSLSAAVTESGFRAVTLLGAAVMAPLVAHAVHSHRLIDRARSLARRVAACDRGRFGVPTLAVAGAVVTVMLAIFEVYLIHQPSTDPLIRSNHLSMYWVETNRRVLWPLMFAAGFVGVVGLWRLARRGVIVPLVWVGVCAVIGTAGVFDQAIPVWYRFILLYQVPLAAATAVVIAQLRPSATRILICATLALSVSFKLATLFLSPVSVTYAGTATQESWQLGRDIPTGSGLIASDPFTSYFIPAATGHRTLTVTKAHTGSQAELDASNSGYLLLRRFAAGGSDDWWPAAQTMWRRGVRYVVVEKWTRIAAPDLTSFSTGPTPLIRTSSERRAEGTYFYRLNRVGHLIHDDGEFAVYQLDEAKLA